MIKKINILMLTMFNIGKSNYAPGTVASFVTSLIYIFFFIYKVNILFLLVSVIIILFYSVYAIDYFKKYFTEIDAKEIVIDEFIGQSIPILTIYTLIPSNNISDFIWCTFVSFVLFRVFDIAKPYPIGTIDKKMKNGFGVVLDDIIAGFYSIIILLLLIFIINYVQNS
jgi:phosphatidylglycerophosphatase A